MFNFAWFDSGHMFGVSWCVSSALCTLVPCWFCPRSTGVWIILRDTSEWFRIQLFLVRRWIRISVSLRRPGCFHALLRESGPRILILRSIPPCAGGVWTNFTHFPHEDGFGSGSRALQMMGGICFSRILRHFSHSVRTDVSAHFSALDDEELFVVEGSGWRGRRRQQGAKGAVGGRSLDLQGCRGASPRSSVAWCRV